MKILSVLLLFSGMLCAQIPCGTERVLVKTLKDNPHLAAQGVTKTIDSLRDMKAPAWGNNTPRHPQETAVLVVNADLVAFKLEADNDIHLVIAEPGTTHTMIAEIPHPMCGRPQDAQTFERLRELIATFHAPTKKLYTLPKPVHLQLQGVLFFDKIHGQDGVAPNGVELHPVLSITR